MNNESELYHYGVKGMKWGVRRQRNTDTIHRKNTVKKTSNSESNIAKKFKKWDEKTDKATVRALNNLDRAEANIVKNFKRWDAVTDKATARALKDLDAGMDKLSDKIAKKDTQYTKALKDGKLIKTAKTDAKRGYNKIERGFNKAMDFMDAYGDGRVYQK